MTNLSNAFVCSDHPGACLCEAAKALASACERECYFVLFHCFCDRDRALFVPTQCAWNAPMRPISARPALTFGFHSCSLLRGQFFRLQRRGCRRQRALSSILHTCFQQCPRDATLRRAWSNASSKLGGVTRVVTPRKRHRKFMRVVTGFAYAVHACINKEDLLASAACELRRLGSHVLSFKHNSWPVSLSLPDAANNRRIFLTPHRQATGRGLPQEHKNFEQLPCEH